MQLDIPPELAQFVDREIASGRFQSREELVLAGLRLLKQDRDDALAGIREGIEQWKRGEGTPLDEAFGKLARG